MDWRHRLEQEEAEFARKYGAAAAANVREEVLKKESKLETLYESIKKLTNETNTRLTEIQNKIEGTKPVQLLPGPDPYIILAVVVVMSVILVWACFKYCKSDRQPAAADKGDLIKVSAARECRWEGQ